MAIVKGVSSNKDFVDYIITLVGGNNQLLQFVINELFIQEDSRDLFKNCESFINHLLVFINDRLNSLVLKVFELMIQMSFFFSFYKNRLDHVILCSLMYVTVISILNKTKTILNQIDSQFILNYAGL